MLILKCCPLYWIFDLIISLRNSTHLANRLLLDGDVDIRHLLSHKAELEELLQKNYASGRINYTTEAKSTATDMVRVVTDVMN